MHLRLSTLVTALSLIVALAIFTWLGMTPVNDAAAASCDGCGTTGSPRKIKDHIPPGVNEPPDSWCDDGGDCPGGSWTECGENQYYYIQREAEDCMGPNVEGRRCVVTISFQYHVYECRCLQQELRCEQGWSSSGEAPFPLQGNCGS